MANWCFPVNMNLIYFGPLNPEKEEKGLTLKENGQQDTRFFLPNPIRPTVPAAAGAWGKRIDPP
jgi:hypothetical protein